MTELQTNPGTTAPAPPRKKYAPAKDPLPGTNYHRLRKTIHVICVVIFITLPLLNIMRFDIPRQRFYFFGAELWINEFGIIFLSLMFCLFLVTAMAMIYGRMYCSYLCPQMIFSEASVTLEDKLKRWVNKRFIDLAVGTRIFISRSFFYAILLVASVFLAFIFISYFVEPRDLVHRLAHLDIKTAGGIAGAVTTLLTLIDFAFLRQRFCTTVCPYGYLQGILADKNTLLIDYRDETKMCIKCLKCVRVCPMGIDIRDSSHQIECTHCGECIDACSTVLGKLGKPTLIDYAWGATGLTVGQENAWYRKLGLRDAKRVIILLLVVLYASALYIAISMRQPVLVRIAPDRTNLYTIDNQHFVHNKFRLQLSNRGHSDTTLNLAIQGLADAHIIGLQLPLTLKPGAVEQQEFEIIADPSKVAPGVNYIHIVPQLSPDQKVEPFAETFIAPMDTPQSTTQQPTESKP